MRYTMILRGWRSSRSSSTYTMLLVMCTLVAHVVRVHEDIRSSYSMRCRRPDTQSTRDPYHEMER